MSGYGKVDTTNVTSSSTANCCEFFEDLIYGVTPEKKKSRIFYRKQLPLLRAGGMFKLVYVGKSRGSSTLAAAATNYASSVLGMFSSSGSNSSQDKNADTSSRAKLGEGVWVSLVEEDTILEWKTLSNVENKPKAMQHIQLYQIHRASKSRCNDNSTEAETRRLTLEDNNGDRIVSKVKQKYHLSLHIIYFYFSLCYNEH
jgi:hypothetical protein